MNIKIVLSCACVALVWGLASASVPNSEWKAYKAEFGKFYLSVGEELFRRGIFERCKAKLEKFNMVKAEEAGYTQGINHLSDRTEQEMKLRRGLILPESRRGNGAKQELFLQKILNSTDEIPDSVDWTKVPHRVSKVKDQGQCGSCWAFASTGGLEGQMLSKVKSLIPLSEQLLVDCSKKNYGCNGGFMSGAYDDIKRMGGIEDEHDYPYTARDGKCKFDKSSIVFNDGGSAELPEGDEKKLMEVVAKFGPVPVAIDASNESFQSYSSGVYYETKCSSTELDHGVLVVGYGHDEEGGDYWLIKNSWGTGWGQSGYMKLARNKNNHCGVATAAVIPTF